VSQHEIKPLEVKWGYIPHRIVAYGEAEALHAFSQALTYSDLRVGQVGIWKWDLTNINCQKSKQLIFVSLCLHQNQPVPTFNRLISS
jgi:hypothetical protein